MDLALGAKKVMVLMEHTERDGTPRIVKELTLPVTGRRAANFILTNLAFIEVTPQGLVLKEVAPGVSVEEVKSSTEPELIISPELKEMEV